MVAAALPWGRELTVDDLDEMPDDGRRRELVDGVLVVTPAPGVPHQVVVANLVRLLLDTHVDGTVVLPAPVDWVPEGTTVLQPDVVVVERAEAGEARLTRVPLLVVEVLSPSTRSYDLGMKRLAYARRRVPVYWVVDPTPPVTLTVFHLEGDAFVEVAAVSGTEPYQAGTPFHVTVVPARLADL